MWRSLAAVGCVHDHLTVIEDAAAAAVDEVAIGLKVVLAVGAVVRGIAPRQAYFVTAAVAAVITAPVAISVACSVTTTVTASNIIVVAAIVARGVAICIAAVIALLITVVIAAAHTARIALPTLAQRIVVSVATRPTLIAICWLG